MDLSTELEKLKAESAAHASDVTQIHTNLAHLYQISHALEIAIANAQQTVRTADKKKILFFFFFFSSHSQQRR